MTLQQAAIVGNLILVVVTAAYIIVTGMIVRSARRSAAAAEAAAAASEKAANAAERAAESSEKTVELSKQSLDLAMSREKPELTLEGYVDQSWGTPQVYVTITNHGQTIYMKAIKVRTRSVRPHKDGYFEYSALNLDLYGGYDELIGILPIERGASTLATGSAQPEVEGGPVPFPDWFNHIPYVAETAYSWFLDGEMLMAEFPIAGAEPRMGNAQGEFESSPGSAPS